jgi:hypothetical protein
MSLLTDDPDSNPWVFQTNNTLLRSRQVSATGLPIPVGHNLWVTSHLQVFKALTVFIFLCQINIINKSLTMTTCSEEHLTVLDL